MVQRTARLNVQGVLNTQLGEHRMIQGIHRHLLEKKQTITLQPLMLSGTSYDSCCPALAKSLQKLKSMRACRSER